MKKRFSLSIVFFAVLICSVVLSAACSNQKQPYYGTYEGGPTADGTIVIDGKNFTMGGKSNKYSVSDDTISVEVDSVAGKTTLDFTMHENYHVLSLGIMIDFSAGDIPNRNGASSCMFYISRNNKISETYSFSMDGTYAYYNVNDYSLMHAGKYTAKNGVIVLNGTYNVSKKSYKNIWYITENGQIHYGVYVKNLENFIEPIIPKYYITYQAEEGGYIDGEQTQTVKRGESGSAVTAIANEGYLFAGWSDGVETAERRDENITEDINVKAFFEKNNTTEFAEGSGSERYPYKITAQEHLVNMALYPEAHYVLESDITLPSVNAGEANFNPLFSEEVKFNGIFDGNGHTIRNISIYNTASRYTGLFAYIGESGIIKNITLENATIHGKGYVGGIAGYSQGVISDCKITGKVSASSAGYIGGIAGYAEQTVSGCRAETELSAESVSIAGGLIGEFNGEAVTDCSAVGSINMDASTAGGLIGIFRGNTLASCSAAGNVTLKDTSSSAVSAGGLVGRIGSVLDEITITDCTATGDISVTDEKDVYAGGLIGNIYDGVTLTNCSATGNVTSVSTSSPSIDFPIYDAVSGGLIGSVGGLCELEKCFTTGDVSVSSTRYAYAGGLVASMGGVNDARLPCVISNCYTTGRITTSAGFSSYAGGFAGLVGQCVVNTSYTVSFIEGKKAGEHILAGAFFGDARPDTSHNVHWLYHAESGTENAVCGEEIKDFGTTKHTAAADFYTLANTLNASLQTPVWENKTENSLPTFIGASDNPDVPVEPSEPEKDEFTLTYAAEEGGRIIGTLTQTVKKGENGASVMAIADSGYEFVGWSDGVKTAERLDENVTKDITVTAQFEKIPEYTLTYTAEEGGRIEGEVLQTVIRGGNGTSVIAVAEDGYEFVGWSDGIETAERSEENVTKDITVTAQFEKIPEYTLTYTAEEGGRIEGEVLQTVIRGGNGTSVIAVAEDGYEFVGWSDGIETAERSDENVMENINVTALFEDNNTILFAGGSGSEKNPYRIAEIEHLQNMDMFPNAHYQLQNDIILSAVSDGFSNFTPLFDDETMFGGVLDGNGFAIENLTIYNENTFYTGLFSCVGESGSVKNLSLKNVKLSGANYVGGIAGYALGKITDCSVSGTITCLAENDYKVFLGGIAGRAENDLNGCDAQVVITAAETGGETYAGGIAGYCSYDMRNAKEPMSVFAEVSVEVSSKNRVSAGGLFGYAGNGNELILSDCYATGNVSVTASSSDSSSYAYAGGLVGMFSGDNTLTNCYATGDVSASSSSLHSYAYAGGLVGQFDSSSNTLTNCYATGDVSATASASSSSSYAGGLVGWFDSGSNTLTNCYATGDVSSTDISQFSAAGGLVGRFSGETTLTNCYATGNVFSSSPAGGLIGQYYSIDSLILTNCYATGDVSSRWNVGGLIGKCSCSESRTILTNCYATGNVSATSSDAGGLVGEFDEGEIILTNCYATGNVSTTSSDAYAGGLVGHFTSSSNTLTNCYATGDVSATVSASSSDLSSYAGGLVGRFDSSSNTLTNCYTVSRILDNDSKNKYWGALVGYADSLTITNAHWLYFSESGVEYAVGYNADMGIPTSIGSVKHTAIEEFYTLADVLNQGQETPSWEHKTENSLPTLIEKINEEEK